jgi:hypothetical protein
VLIFDFVVQKKVAQRTKVQVSDTTMLIRIIKADNKTIQKSGERKD